MRLLRLASPPADQICPTDALRASGHGLGTAVRNASYLLISLSPLQLCYTLRARAQRLCRGECTPVSVLRRAWWKTAPPWEEPR